MSKACEVKELLGGKLNPAIVDLRFVKPLDEQMLLELSKKYKKWYVFSDSAKIGGVGSVLCSWLQESEIYDVSVKSFEYEDSFIQHGKRALVEESLGLSSLEIANTLKNNNQ